MKPAIRQKTNIIIDIFMFVVMVVLAIIGIVIRYTLIPGSERWEKYGQNVELTILGMDRHDWGLIHLIVGILLIGLLVLHLLLHWKLIVVMAKKLLPNVIIRIMLTSFILALSVALLGSLFIIKPEIGDPIAGQGQRLSKNFQVGSHNETDSLRSKRILQDEVKLGISAEREIEKENQHEKEEHLLDIRGYHTISELARKYDIAAGQLKTKLHVPSSVSNEERLGRIRRTYNFTMSDVESAILDLQGAKH